MNSCVTRRLRGFPLVLALAGLLVGGPQTSHAGKLNDYNNDGASDLTAVFPSYYHGGTWYARSLDVGKPYPRIIAWGAPKPTPVGSVPQPQSAFCIPVPGDYDGDGKYDIANYSAIKKRLRLYTVGGVLLKELSWAWPGDTPVPGDYDGDGRSDLAMFWSTYGKWYIQGSLTSSSVKAIAYGIEWGSPSMIPVPGDYDGDGRSDLAMWNPVTGRWYIRTLTGKVLVWNLQWGARGMVPVPGDYNSDKIWDLALYQESTGRWYILPLRADGATGKPVAFAKQWGYPGAAAVPGDYDGDNRCDLAVYDRMSGVWYVLKVQPYVKVLATVGDVQFGGAGLTPAGVSGPFIANSRSVQFVEDRPGTTWQLMGTGGLPPYQFSANSALPAGLTLSSSGLISGTPSVSGGFAFYVTMTDNNGCSCLSQLSMSIVSPY